MLDNFCKLNNQQLESIANFCGVNAEGMDGTLAVSVYKMKHIKIWIVSHDLFTINCQGDGIIKISREK